MTILDKDQQIILKVDKILNQSNAHLCCSGVMRILKQVPELLLCWGEAAISEVVLLLLIRGSLGQQPPADRKCPVN